MPARSKSGPEASCARGLNGLSGRNGRADRPLICHSSCRGRDLAARIARAIHRAARAPARRARPGCPAAAARRYSSGSRPWTSPRPSTGECDPAAGKTRVPYAAHPATSSDEDQLRRARPGAAQAAHRHQAQRHRRRGCAAQSDASGPGSSSGQPPGRAVPGQARLPERPMCRQRTDRQRGEHQCSMTATMTSIRCIAP